jgi:hypothetical protein
VIAWILDLGPGAPTGPPEFESYRRLSDRTCGSVEERLDELSEATARLYRAAANACLAALNNKQSLWGQAEAAFKTLSPDAERLNCMDRAVFELLKRLVLAHQANPAGAFAAATDPKQAQPPPCPTITRLDPSRGPPGTTVTIQGTNLERVEQVVVEYDNGNVDDLLTFTRKDGGLVVTVAGSADAGTACIVLRTQPNGWTAAGAPFEIEVPAPTASGSLAGSAANFRCPPVES